MDTGIVVAYAGSQVPAGWLPCDGRSLDKNNPDYVRLFNVIGTTHGGDATPMFQLPDYRGMFLRGVDGGRGMDPEAGSRTPPGHHNTGNAGDRVGSVQGDMIGGHTHSYHARRLEAEGGGGFLGSGFDSNSNQGAPWARDFTSSTAGGTETRPRNAAVLYIIKL